jgi:hypothetical protein
VEVKPLEWTQGGPGYTYQFAASTVVGVYEIWSYDGLWTVYLEQKKLDVGLPASSDAKAAAQADYEQRILSALRSPPERRDAPEPVAWLTTWKRDGEEWVNAHANEVTAIDEARRHRGTCTPLYASPTHGKDGE